MSKRLLVLVTVLLMSIINVFGSTNDHSWLDDTFFQDGKYRVVIAILSIIFLGLMIFVGMLERRVHRLEQNIGNGSDD